MKHQLFYEPRCGKFVCQLPMSVTFAYNVHLGNLGDHYKGLVDEHTSENGVNDSF
jgi:hypothetical protein